MEKRNKGQDSPIKEDKIREILQYIRQFRSSVIMSKGQYISSNLIRYNKPSEPLDIDLPILNFEGPEFTTIFTFFENCWNQAISITGVKFNRKVQGLRYRT